jgi:hypothetical protein
MTAERLLRKKLLLVFREANLYCREIVYLYKGYNVQCQSFLRFVMLEEILMKDTRKMAKMANAWKSKMMKVCISKLVWSGITMV